MQTSLTDERAEQKRAFANRIKRIVAIVLGAVILYIVLFLTSSLFLKIRYIL